jgi:hypothetical protein
MSQLNVDIIKNKAGTGGPTLQALTVTTNATVTGVVTASSFVGPVTGNVTGTATGLSGSPSITVSGVNNTGIATALEFDITGSTNSLSSGGLTVGVATLTTLSGTSGFVSLGSTLRTRGFVETQSTVSIAGTVLTLDASQGTVFTHTTSANIGVVSFTGVSTASAGSQTFSVLVTQGATPFNTTAATGIGTALARVVSTGSVGYSTHVKVGGGSTITLTGTAGALDLLTFIVSYDGTIPPVNSSFKVVGFAATDFRNAVV